MGTNKNRRWVSPSPMSFDAPLYSPSPTPVRSSRIPRQPIHPPCNIKRQDVILCNKCINKSVMVVIRLIECGFYKDMRCSSRVSHECINRCGWIKPKVTYVAICRNNRQHAQLQSNIVCVNCIEYFERYEFLDEDTFRIRKNFYR